jgi:hypothetical protein
MVFLLSGLASDPPGRSHPGCAGNAYHIGFFVWTYNPSGLHPRTPSSMSLIDDRPHIPAIIFPNSRHESAKTSACFLSPIHPSRLPRANIQSCLLKTVMPPTGRCPADHSHIFHFLGGSRNRQDTWSLIWTVRSYPHLPESAWTISSGV